MNNIYLIRMKLIFQDKMTCIVMLVTLLLFLFIMNSLSLGAQEKSSIPIGLINLDHTESAEQLAENVRQVPALFVYEGDKTSLMKLLYEEQINSIFVINEGYEESIQRGKSNKLITMYYLEDNKTAKIISDIIAGEMLFKISLYKGFNLYKSLPVNKNKNDNSDSEIGELDSKRYTEDEYLNYAQKLLESSDYNFSFDITLVNVEKNEEVGKKIDNSMLYQQIIWAILGMLLSFVAMFMVTGIVLDKEMGLDKRIRISSLRIRTVDYSHLFAILTVLSIYSLLLCILVGSKLKEFTLWQGGSLYLLLLLFSLCLALWFILLGKVIRQVGRYQYIGSFSILLFGFIGFFYLVKSFVNSELLNISYFIPNSWFIQGFTDIILNTSLQDIPYTAHKNLAIIGLCLFILNGLIGRRQNR